MPLLWKQWYKMEASILYHKQNLIKYISLLFGIPKYVIDADRTYSVLCVQPDGSYIELKDMDNDSGTITIDTTAFGKYVIVY